MADVIFKRVDDAIEATEAIENGKLLYNYQSKKISIDNGGARLYFYDFIGLLTSLTTTAKDTIVNAINELVTKTNTTNTNVGTLSNLTTSAKSSLVVATNEVNANIGTLSSLTTVVKTSVVNSINWMIGILLPASITSYYTIEKPTIAVYGQTHRYYSVPFNRADLYNIYLNDVNIVGLSSILTSCSISARYPTGFQILDTSNQGAGYILQVVFTATKL